MVNTTLIIHWAFSVCAFFLISLRLFLRKYRRLNFTQGDYCAMGAFFCALVRLALIHIVLIWGTNNMPAALRETLYFSAQDIRQREIGSKCVLADRFFYNS
jgi:hypothetical protein